MLGSERKPHSPTTRAFTNRDLVVCYFLSHQLILEIISHRVVLVVGTMLIVMHLLSTLADTFVFQQPYPTRTEVNHLYFLQPRLLLCCSMRKFDQSLCLKTVIGEFPAIFNPDDA